VYKNNNNTIRNRCLHKLYDIPLVMQGTSLRYISKIRHSILTLYPLVHILVKKKRKKNVY